MRLYPNGVLDTSEWRTGSVDATSALAVDVFYACVRLICDGVSSAVWGEWRGLERLLDSRLTRRPMSTLTRREWTWKVAATMAIYNVCPLQIRGGLDSEGVPWSLVPLYPPALTPNPGQASYIYAGTETIPADDLRWVRRTLFPTATPEIQAILSIAHDQIAAAASAADYVSSWWESGGAPIVVLSTDQELSADQGEQIAARWLERREKGPAYPAVLGKGAKAAPFGADLGTDAAAAAQDRLLASIARYMGVPAAYVNAPSYAGSLTYQNVEQAGLDLVRYTFTAYSAPIGDVMSDALPGDYLEGRAVRLDLSHLTRGGQLDRYNSYAAAKSAGWLTVDEIREAEGYPPMEEGEEPAPTPEPAPEVEAFA